MKFKKAVIIGPGLIGASIGLCLKKLNLAQSVVGVARRNSTLKKAKERKAIDSGFHDAKAAVEDADLVILATPVETIKKILPQISHALKKGCIVFDAGSTKQEIVDKAQHLLDKNVYFVGVHPMAGSEKAGPEFATDILFKDAFCFIVKTTHTNPCALKKVAALWRLFGSKIIVVTPQEHDNIVAAVSHLPHLAAVALVDSIPADFIKYSASGFKDTTRIASGDPAIWTDVCLSNRQKILKAISRFEHSLKKIKKLLQKKNRSGLTGCLLRSKLKRDRLYKN